MCDNLCRVHRQKFKECLPLHKSRDDIHFSKLVNRRVTNLVTAEVRREIDTKWTWTRKWFCSIRYRGQIIRDFGKRNDFEQPNRDIGNTNLVLNFPKVTNIAQDEQSS